MPYDCVIAPIIQANRIINGIKHVKPTTKNRRERLNIDIANINPIPTKNNRNEAT